MRKVVAFFVNYPIWANAIIIFVFLFGLSTYFFNLKKSSLPERPPRNITVSMSFPGASPEEVEEGITIKIEEAIKGIVGIEEINSTSSENTANVSIKTAYGVNLDEVLSDVKNAVDRINSFPVGAEKPSVFKQKPTTMVAFMGVRGKVSLRELKDVADRVESDFLNSGVVSQMILWGYPELEISIEATEDNLRRYGLTFDQLANAVRFNNRDVSGGSIKTVDEEIRIRARAKEFDPSFIEEIVVRANPDGSKLLLRDVAEVHLQFADQANRVYHNGDPSISIVVQKLVEEDIQEISAFVQDYAEKFNAENPNFEIFTYFDFTTLLNQRLEMLTRNFGAGLFLVLLTLGLFLSLRLSLWVALGIPLSFCAMFIIGDMAGITINLLSLLGMLLVVGILVDDGIVIAENIYTHFEKGKEAHQAAIDGTMEVLPSVFTSVVTTMVAFSPLIFLDNDNFTREMAIVVVACLGFSLIEAFFVLPAHLAHKWVLSKRTGSGGYVKFRKFMERIVNQMRFLIYAPVLKMLLKWRWVSVTLPVAFFMIMIGLMAGGIVKFTPFQRPPVDDINVDLVLKPGTRENVTEGYLTRFQDKVWQINKRLIEDRNLEDSVITSVDLVIGSISDRSTSGSHAGRLTVNFNEDLDALGVSSFEVNGMLKKELGEVPEAEKFTIGSQNYWGKPVSISLKSKNIKDLDLAKEEVKAALTNLPSLTDIVDNSAVGQRELELKLKPFAYYLGLTHQDITNQIRQGFFGEEVQRLQIGSDEVRVWVRYPEEDRLSISQLESMKVKMPNGAEYPITELVDYEIVRGVININRFNGKREIRVMAELASAKDVLPPILEKVKTDIMPPIIKKYAGLEYSFEGQSRRQSNEMTSLINSLFPVLALMILLITLEFRSLSQTFLILALVPIGVGCAILGHFIEGAILSIISIYGIIALSGVIVNDAIVMLDKFNKLLKEGLPVFDAAYRAGIARFRAIVLTSVTTVAGLFPLIRETSFQAQWVIPMGISLAYGVLFGTFFILCFFPVNIMVYNDIKVFMAWTWRTIRLGHAPKPDGREVEPAVKEFNRMKRIHEEQRELDRAKQKKEEEEKELAKV